MKEDNISLLGDYEAPFCEQQHTHEPWYISLFKFKSFEQFNTPQTVPNFRHLLSCGTIEADLLSVYALYIVMKNRLTDQRFPVVGHRVFSNEQRSSQGNSNKNNKIENSKQ